MMDWLRGTVPVERWFLLVVVAMAIYIGIDATASYAATVEVQVRAQRDGYARLHAEGLYVEGCMMQTGPCKVQTSTGRATTRRVRVHKGRNSIRLKAFRWERMDPFAYVRLYPPESRPAAWPSISVPLNWVYVWGRVAGREIEPIEIKLSSE